MPALDSRRHVELAMLNITIKIKTKLLIHDSNFVENKCLDATVSNLPCGKRTFDFFRCAQTLWRHRRRRRLRWAVVERNLVRSCSKLPQFKCITHIIHVWAVPQKRDRKSCSGAKKSTLIDALINMRSRNSHNFRQSVYSLPMLLRHCVGVRGAAVVRCGCWLAASAAMALRKV